MIKHSALISRIEKSGSKSKKRRRPSKKLVANLQSLADALPDEEGVEGAKTVLGNAKITHRSLKSQPGAMKKKENLEKMERERFEKNMAQLAELRSSAGDTNVNATQIRPGATGGRGSAWAALRGFIQQTMEQRPGS